MTDLKFIVVLLLALNVFLLSWWTGWLSLWDNREPDRLRKQVDAERISVQPGTTVTPKAQGGNDTPASSVSAAVGAGGAPVSATEGVSGTGTIGSGTTGTGTAGTGAAGVASAGVTSTGPASSGTTSSGAPSNGSSTTTAGPTPAAGAALATATPQANTCLEFPAMDADKAQAIEASMKQAGLSVETSRQDSATSFMVLLPPSESTREAQRKLTELKRLGVSEAFLMQEGPYKLGISLGVFRSEEGAKALVQQLLAKGIRSARVAPASAARASKTILKATGTEAQLTRVRQAATEVNLNLKACAG